MTAKEIIALLRAERLIDEGCRKIGVTSKAYSLIREGLILLGEVGPERYATRPIDYRAADEDEEPTQSVSEAE